jgi:hypothetical protein
LGALERVGSIRVARFCSSSHVLPKEVIASATVTVPARSVTRISPSEVHENLDRRVLDEAVDASRGLPLDDLVAYAVEFIDSNV